MAVALVASALALSACGSKQSSFSLLSDQSTFKQNSAPTNGKIDVLWVVDNSGSMETSQQNVAANFQRFIEGFNAKGFDYQLAVITSDAYRGQFNPALKDNSLFKDGTNWTSRTGIPIVTPAISDPVGTFLINVQQGIYGAGDERAFQSITAALNEPRNGVFPRPDAFLAVIIVSDEDDFSHDGSNSLDSQYNNANLHPVQKYIDYLDAKMGATPSNRSSKYNVNSIAILDETCRASLSNQFTERKIGKRYIDLSDATSGVKGSLCSDFGSTMANISNKIIELTTQFYLQDDPNLATLRVFVDGKEAPALTGTEPSPWSGYLYHPETNSITFHGSWVPGPGATINVVFDPKSLR